MGAGGSTPPRKRNVKGVLPTAPIFGWGRGGIRKQERKQVIGDYHAMRLTARRRAIALTAKITPGSA